MDRTALPAGTRLGEIEILKVIAVGGFGIVYLARDRSLDREVAVKEFMPTHLVGRGTSHRVSLRADSNAETYALALQSFIDEARLLARFAHPSVVKVYRCWKANGTGYMAMPYLRGPTLGDLRRSMSAPPTERWLRSMIDPLLVALEMLHDEGVYHRDIAPDNVLLNEAGQPVLLDFGAARHLIADRSQAPTAIIKPRYAPIEQYAEASQVRQGPWTDLYGLAALVTFLIDGSPPPVATVRSVHDDREPLAGRRIPGVTPRFLAAIDWALEVRPHDRPQSVAEFRAAIEGRRLPPIRLLAPARRAAQAQAALRADGSVFPVTQQLVPLLRPMGTYAPARDAADDAAEQAAGSARAYAATQIEVSAPIVDAADVERAPRDATATAPRIASIPPRPRRAAPPPRPSRFVARAFATALAGGLLAWAVVGTGASGDLVRQGAQATAAATGVETASNRSAPSTTPASTKSAAAAPAGASPGSIAWSTPAPLPVDATSRDDEAVPVVRLSPATTRSDEHARGADAATVEPVVPVPTHATQREGAAPDGTADALRDDDEAPPTVRVQPARGRAAPTGVQRENRSGATSRRSTSSLPRATLVTRVVLPGPIELCAERNFLFRPYCIQQRCDESRFRQHPQCLQRRQLADSGRRPEHY